MLPTEKSRRIPCTPGRHCPVCDGDHKCSVGEDELIFCGRITGQVQGFKYLGQCKGDAQFAMYRREDDFRLQDDGSYRNGSSNGNGHKNGWSTVDWPFLARKFRDNLTDDLRRKLADELGLPPVATLCIDLLGYEPNEGCWTLPEWNGFGKIIGINRRLPDGSKRLMHGGSRGLTISNSWKTFGGPILIPEGASDTMALHAMGLSAIGRPSSTGGVEHLIDLLAGEQREIIVLGENDQKPNGNWPGLEGARRAAERLVASGKKADWKIPADSFKDARDWYKRN